ncbi:hypothetical protein ACEPAG_949 [Sanghuangporus baumii]
MPENGIIAVDLDDVLSQTNQAVADWHNAKYGTRMTLDDFHYYHYWKNPDWGTPVETHDKVKDFYATNLVSPKPVPGALEGVKALKGMGYKLVIITARHAEQLPITKQWIDQHFPNMFDDIVCTGMFLKDEEANEVQVKLGKPEVCHRLNARLLIDDSAENALACARDASPPIPVLLFGDYSWNRRVSKLENREDHLGYKERLEFEHKEEWWRKEKVDSELPPIVKRMKDWEEVVEYVKAMSESHDQKYPN